MKFNVITFIVIIITLSMYYIPNYIDNVTIIKLLNVFKLFVYFLGSVVIGLSFKEIIKRLNNKNKIKLS